MSHSSTESRSTVMIFFAREVELFWQLWRVGYAPYQELGRRHPAAGVHIYSGQATIVFLTVCAQDRKPCLANNAVHESLRAAWQSAQAWLVGYYLVMPDHVHVFCAPHDVFFTLEKWVTFWEREFRRLGREPLVRCQAHPFHHRLRRQENYTEKWNYVRENPLRKGLVKEADDWPYQGMMNALRW
jgi:putative transposase